MRIGIAGAAGRMGRLLVQAVAGRGDAVLAGGTVRPGGKVGADLGMLAGIGPREIAATDDPAALFQAADAVIDFTHPDALATHLGLAERHGTALVIGTSGLSLEQERAIAETARSVPIVYAANFSAGVALLLALVRRAAETLGPEYDIEIVEMHHRQKIDAPSGTAIAMGRAAAAGRGITLEDNMESGRHGHTGRRRDGAIGFAALRGGQVVGEHTAIFAAATEHLTIGHRSFDRRVYAEGAVRAALWLAGKPAGLYGMEDVLGLR
ncbi:4-hydroxy-tetrahydrodipicolinate reductase [Elioraea sp.]|uniref:4-hydroxy-tetrahydrodipicolinate reductase n=1 Tax=Elioraea sp. TaxID=2185103 RepID=UPI0021DE7EA7|nr:4-hydroxy-tetrahydrodipicolinate reductase [Elioraea sp.]GIX10394.1 MAG: 4-hydroxy-tetrahydrodipicolinate reductase [Elioraea sp.]